MFPGKMDFIKNTVSIIMIVNFKPCGSASKTGNNSSKPKSFGVISLQFVSIHIIRFHCLEQYVDIYPFIDNTKNIR